MNKEQKKKFDRIRNNLNKVNELWNKFDVHGNINRAFESHRDQYRQISIDLKK